MSWMHRVATLPLSLNVSVVFLISLVLGWLLVRLVRHYAPYPLFKENNELVGFAYAVFGLIYGVLLAFTIVVAWERFSDAERIITREVTILSELWRDSQAFAPEVRRPVHETLLQYARSVADDEWPEMARSGRPHPGTARIYERLWDLSYTLQPATKNQEAYLAEFLARMNELSVHRRMRMLASHTEVQAILWSVLLVGACLTIGYTLLFANRHGWVQWAVTTSMILIIVLNLMVVIHLQYPFTGSAAVEPEAFRELVATFGERLAARPGP